MGNAHSGLIIVGHGSECLAPRGISVLQVRRLAHVHTVSNVHCPEDVPLVINTLSGGHKQRRVSVSVNDILAVLKNSGESILAGHAGICALMSVHSDATGKELMWAGDVGHVTIPQTNERGQVKAAKACKRRSVGTDVLLGSGVVVGVDEDHLAVCADCSTELLNDLGSGVECCLEFAGVLARATLDPASHFGGVGDVSNEQQYIGLDVLCCIHKLLHESRIVEWDLKVWNNHCGSHGKSVAHEEGVMVDVLPEMDPKVKADWLAALRSGEFEQGKGHLNKNGLYCCLGVLCEVAIRSGQEVQRIKSNVDGTTYYDGVSSFPADSIYRWAGMYNSYKYELKLASMNDEGKSFQEIADWIEENL